MDYFEQCSFTISGKDFSEIKPWQRIFERQDMALRMSVQLMRDVLTERIGGFQEYFN